VNLRANTKAGYRSILRQYLRPAFGSVPLARIDVLAVRSWLAKLEVDGVGQATRAKAYRLLARILGAAVEARYLAVTLRHPPGGSEAAPEMRIATIDQVAVIAHRVPPPLPGAGPGRRLRWAGHSTTVAAVRYQHVMADRDAAIACELNRLIDGG
jgi:Phage integrase, N-terminal SAM-like domain